MMVDEETSSSINQGEYNFGDDGLAINNNTTNKRVNNIDENVLKLRRTLYTLANKTLKSLIMSPVELSKFREEMNIQINRSDIGISMENFTQNMFAFFNERLFFNLLTDSVKINWSKRFKS
jgi:hypothetical protein